MSSRTKNRLQVPFSQKLVIQQWLMSLFKVKDFNELALQLKLVNREGIDEHNTHHFYYVLATYLDNPKVLPSELLLEYDQNIVRHTHKLNEERDLRGEATIVWKHFQYLGLLFCEIYLDFYFNNPEALLQELNQQVKNCNTRLPESEEIPLFNMEEDAWTQLNKLAIWMATGSGKTLIMHVNVLQYQHYHAKHGNNEELNRILLLTPNEGLSKQHLEEFRKANIDAVFFSKSTPSFHGRKSIEILEITRLRDEMGDKTVAVEAFEGNNLVFVDEGHRGTSSGREGAWMRHRDALCEKGFSFEYSATFGQALKGNPELTEMYAKSTLFDYSYRYFYEDGFGKDYLIFNIDRSSHENQQDLYLVACLLTFFEQQRLYKEFKDDCRVFNIEKPLWIFVGGRVVKKWSAEDASDIVSILLFIDRYAKNQSGRSLQLIREILDQGIRDSTGKNLFEGRFQHLGKSGLSPEKIFYESLKVIFNAPSGGRLYLENLRGVTGEISLRLGADNDPFGVINVGDSNRLLKLCENHSFNTGEHEFSDSLFQEINKKNSNINLLIGSRKFTEGWNSWRVSTMGLMNIGKTEGTQILQLFGRGIRLKGYGHSLKRSRAGLPDGVQPPIYIDLLETLGIFGLNADYMAQFREYLEEEGLSTNNCQTEFVLPTITNLGKQKLKTIQLKKTINGVPTKFGDAFRKLGPIPTLAPPDSVVDGERRFLLENPVILNWYPKIKAMKSKGLEIKESNEELNCTHFSRSQIAFLDLRWLYFELERYKTERGWHNLSISMQGIDKLLRSTDWYRLFIPEYELIPDDYEKVKRWQEIALTLLKKYTHRYYTYRKHQWEEPYLEYIDLDSNDTNLIGEYRVLIDRSKDEVKTKLIELKELIQSGRLKQWEFQDIHAIDFSQHLYRPLLFLNQRTDVQVSPVPLNQSEHQFVEDLKRFYETESEFFKTRELYLIRNQSRGRGIGFFEAGNFHPDFILWVLTDVQQTVIFVDPKGTRNLGFDDPKVLFYKTIKEIEQRLGDPNVRLESYIVSNTPFIQMQGLWGKDKREMTSRHILFQEDDKNMYVKSMLIPSSDNAS
ncbi:MAG: DEAD/DEAH box helicase family protein [Gammaproteobacteria bacterium]|nr:DEAD/DEAH box helicase family protein [Gammaproteobacteria bacterium]